MKNSEILKRAKNVIRDPNKWTKKTLECGGSCCMIGAVAKATGKNFDEDCYPAAGDVFGVSIDAIWKFNDAPDTTHEEVLMAMDFAIAFAADEEAWA